jgi:predicted CoA-binding protein
MTTVSQAAADFLARKRIAVAGVSREPASHGANLVYRRLRDRGYTVFATNPKADAVEGDVCYHDLASIPGGIDAVVIATPPGASESVVKEAESLGIDRVWMHQNCFSDEAVAYARDHRIAAIAGACPLMFTPTSDFAHTCMRWALGFSGHLAEVTT